MDPMNEAGRTRVRVGLILLFLATSFLVLFVFFGGTFILGMLGNLHLGFSQQVAVVRGIQVAVILGSLTAALALRKHTRLRPYWRLAFAYFVASSALLLSDYTGDWALLASGQPLNTAKGFAALKLGEDAAIISTIIVLALLTRDDPSDGNCVYIHASGGPVHSIPPYVPRDCVPVGPAVGMDHAEDGECAGSCFVSRRSRHANHCGRIRSVWYQELKRARLRVA